MLFINSTLYLPHNRENAQKGETKKKANRAQLHCDVFI